MSLLNKKAVREYITEYSDRVKGSNNKPERVSRQFMDALEARVRRHVEHQVRLHRLGKTLRYE